MVRKYKTSISLTELSVILKVPKSTLIYYVSMGLIKPKEVVGKMFIFDEKDFLDRYWALRKLQKGGRSLKEIKSLMAYEDL